MTLFTNSRLQVRVIKLWLETKRNLVIGELLVVKPKSWRGALTSSLKGLQGILYDHESDHLLVCDAGSNKIIELDQTTGILSH